MNGFFTVVFEGPVGAGGGVVLLQDGHVLGGDSAYYYEGTFTERENQLNARIDVRVFLQGVQSVFGIAPPFALNITGTFANGEVTGAASLVGNDGARMRFRMVRRAEIPNAAAVGGAR